MADKTRDRSEELAAFLASLEHRTPTIHDELTRHELQRRGWTCQDTVQDRQLLRLISLAAQKFVANVSHDSLQIYKQRRRQTQARLKEQGLKDDRTVLTLEDTAAALQDYGVNMKPVPYYLDAPSNPP